MKDYVHDPFIKTEWDVLKKGLRQARTLTIFGYGAPTTDKEAVDILESAWDKKNRFAERTEIIDIKGKEVLWKQWDRFIVRTYLDCTKDFYQSRLAHYPRRTCEALLEQTRYGLFVEDNPLPSNAGFDELVSWANPFVEAEDSLRKARDERKNNGGIQA